MKAGTHHEEGETREVGDRLPARNKHVALKWEEEDGRRPGKNQGCSRVEAAAQHRVHLPESLEPRAARARRSRLAGVLRVPGRGVLTAATSYLPVWRAERDAEWRGRGEGSASGDPGRRGAGVC